MGPHRSYMKGIEEPCRRTSEGTRDLLCCAGRRGGVIADAEDDTSDNTFCLAVGVSLWTWCIVCCMWVGGGYKSYLEGCFRVFILVSRKLVQNEDIQLAPGCPLRIVLILEP